MSAIIGKSLWSALVLFVDCHQAAIVAQSSSYAVGDEVISRISYQSKKNSGKVTTGERGHIVSLQTSGKTTYAICKFPGWDSAKLKTTDIGKIGEPTLEGFKVGDQVMVWAELDDGELGTLKAGDFGVVLGIWELEDGPYIYCKFESLRRKSPVRPKHLHMKVTGNPAQLLFTLFIAALIALPAVTMLPGYAMGTLEKWKTLPGGYKGQDQVISLITEPSLGIKLGDIGVVMGNSEVDRNVRLRCWFQHAPSTINMHLNQIAKVGEKVGAYHTGDFVYSNLLDCSGSIGLLDGQTLEHGKLGRVLKAGSSEGRLTCVFPDGMRGIVDIEETRIKSKQHYLHDKHTGMKASKDIKKEQREVQKDIVRQARSQRQAEGPFHAAMAEETLPSAVAEDHQENAIMTQEEDEEVHPAFCCNVCLDLLVNPVTLPCGHTVCKVCVENWRSVCGPIFKTPCCARVTPYEFKERPTMSADVMELYPRRIANKIADTADRHEMVQALEQPTDVATTSLTEEGFLHDLLREALLLATHDLAGDDAGRE